MSHLALRPAVEPARHDDLQQDAIERLVDVRERFVRFHVSPPASREMLIHLAGLHLHATAAAVAACESAGLGRSEILPWLVPLRERMAASPFVRRLQTWPRGYAGDFETVEWICDAVNRAHPASAAWAVEQFALQSPVAQQHRNKVALQARAVLTLLQSRPDARVASIGCGGCRDLALVQEHIAAGAGTFTLVDADTDALAFASRRLPRLAARCTPLGGSVPQVLPALCRQDPFDLVVAGGLFDYLPDRLAVATLRAIRRTLAPGGRLLFSNIAAGNPFRLLIEYVADWQLIERDEADLARLLTAAGFDHRQLQTSRDTTGLALIADVQVV